jgi:hypothetical protein
MEMENSDLYLKKLIDNIDSVEINQNFEKIKTPEELLEFMNNIKYGYIGKNDQKIYTSKDKNFDADMGKEYYLQDTKQLLESKRGVCWDQTELERTWFAKQNFDFKVFYLAFVKEEANTLPTHTFLAYKNNDKWYWFEHSFHIHQGIHQYDNLQDLIEDVKKKELAYAIANRGATKNDYNDLKICEYKTPAYGCSADEFINSIVSPGNIS